MNTESIEGRQIPALRQVAIGVPKTRSVALAVVTPPAGHAPIQ